MNTLLFRLLFTIILALTWTANVANATVVEQAVECPCSKGLVVNGVLFVKVKDTVSLRTGQRYKVGEKCDTVNVSLFTARQTCKWDAIVKATAAGLEELPGGVSTESVPRLRKVFGELMVLFSMLTILAPFKMLGALCAAFVSVVSFFGMIVVGMFGAWLLSAAMAVSLISAVYVTASAQWPDTYDPRPYPRATAAKVSNLVTCIIIMAAI